MMIPEARHANEIADEHEFLDKLGSLVVEYRHKIRCGCIVGALETVKLRVFIEAGKVIDKQMEAEEGEDK